MANEPSDANQQEWQRALDRAADDGWSADTGATPIGTNPAEQARRAIALLSAWHDAQPASASEYETIVGYVDDSLSYEAQIRELTHRLQGMTALADFLLANLERATGRDGQAFLQSVAEQADQYFPT